MHINFFLVALFEFFFVLALLVEMDALNIANAAAKSAKDKEIVTCD